MIENALDEYYKEFKLITCAGCDQDAIKCTYHLIFTFRQDPDQLMKML
jgi:hypothetical protein